MRMHETAWRRSAKVGIGKLSSVTFLVSRLVPLASLFLSDAIINVDLTLAVVLQGLCQICPGLDPAPLASTS